MIKSHLLGAALLVVVFGEQSIAGIIIANTFDGGVEGGTIQRADFDGSPLQNVIVSAAFNSGTDLRLPRAIAFDSAGNLYFSTLSSGFAGDPAHVGKIYRSAPDGASVVEIVVANSPRDIDVDPSNAHVYWVDAGTRSLHRSNLDGSEAIELISGLHAPEGLAIDAVNGQLFWTSNESIQPSGNVLPTIMRAHLNGSGITTVVTGAIGNIFHDVDVDPLSGFLYWSSANQSTGIGAISRSTLFGPNSVDLFSGLENPFGLALNTSDSQIYWAAEQAGKIQRGQLSGGGSITEIVSGLQRPFDVNLEFPVIGAVTEPASLAIWGIGLVGLVAGWRRRCKKVIY
jgi:DNA-binding beta-propeller fold protein YncE